MHRMAWLSLSVLLFVCLPAGSAAAANRAYYARYKGSLSEHVAAQLLSQPTGSTVTDYSLTWDDKAYADDTGRITQRTLAVQGRISQVHTGSITTQDFSCSIQQVSSPNPGSLAVGPGDRAGQAEVTGDIPASPGRDVVFSPISDPANFCPGYNGGGSMVGWGSDGSDGTLGAGCSSFTPDPDFIPGFALGNVNADGYSKTWVATQSMTPIPGGCDPSLATTDGTRTINATLTVGAAAPPVHKPRRALGVPGMTLQKLRAKVDLHQSLRAAQALCGPTAVGLAGLWAANNGAPLSPAQLATARQLLAAAGPGCAGALQRIFDDFGIANDPPIASINTLARPRPATAKVVLPACAAQPAAVARYCRTLQTRLRGYIRTIRSTAAIGSALRTTVFRESGAAAARNRNALRRQVAYAKTLQRRFAAAAAAQRKAGAAVARLIKTQGLKPMLTAADAATTIDYVIARLGHMDVTRAQITKFAGAALTPAATDLLVAMR